MVEDTGTALEVGWESERIVDLGVGDDKIVPSLHLWSGPGKSIEGCLWTVDPMFAMPDVVRLCIDW